MNRSLLVCASALTLAAASSASAQGLLITEIMADTPAGPDWFELTNTGTISLTISGYKMDDDSSTKVGGPMPNLAVALAGLTNISAGESVIFIESQTATNPAGNDSASVIQTFRDYWGGRALTMQIGYYIGTSAGVSLGKSGDSVVIFNSANTVVTQQTFGAVTEHISQKFSSATPQVQSQSAIGDGISYQSVGTSFSGTNQPARDIGSPGFAAVPEPASLTLVALGGVLLSRRSRRRG